MHAHAYRAFVAAVVLVTATAPALCEGMGLVSGRVTDERGVPLKGVVVTLSSTAILGVQEATTDDSGRYSFPAVPGNQPLSIKAMSPGRVPLEYVGHTAHLDGTIAIDFKLRAPGDHEILVLVEGEVPYHSIALEGALTTMPGHIVTLNIADNGPETIRALDEKLAQRPSAVLAIGDLAGRLARRHVRDVPVVYSMVPAPLDADLTTRNLCGVPLNGGFAQQIAHLRHVDPQARRVATLYNPRRMGRCLRTLKQATDAAGMELIAARVYGDDARSLDRALDSLRGESVDAFLLLLDPRMMDAGSYQQVVDFAASRDAIMAVPDESLVMPGRSFSFVPGFFDLGAYAGTLVRRIVVGREQPSAIGMVFPDRDAVAMVTGRLEKQTPGDVLRADASTRSSELAHNR